MSRIQFKNIKKRYDSVEIIHGLNLEINPGEFIVLVGPSGCGKSTTLRMLAGLETVSEGELLLNGNYINDTEPKDRDMAMVFQNYALYPHMTIYKNMSYGLKIRGKLHKKEIHKRVAETAEILQIDHLLDRKPSELSGGQRQRVAMGRAIVRHPQVFLFDEPLSNLDAKLRVDMRLEIKNLQKKLGVTSVYVTHDQTEAMTLADRIVVMNAGHADQIGTPQEIYHAPATKFVAGFIGSPSMNFLEAKLEQQHIILPDGTKMPCPDNAKALADQPVELGIRPEHLHIPEDGEIPHIHLEIDTIENLGTDILVYGHLHHCKTRTVVRLPGNWLQNEIKTLDLAIKNEHIHLFDPELEHRLNA